MTSTKLSTLIGFLMFAVGLVLSSAAFAEESEFTLLVGEQKTMDVSNIATVAIGEKKVATATLSGAQLIVTGKGAGVTTLTLIDRAGGSFSYSVRVIARDPQKTAKEVQELLLDVDGVEVKVVGERVFLDGFVYRKEDAARIEKIAKVFEEEVVDLTTFNESFLTILRLVQVDYYRYEIQKEDAQAIGVNWREFFTATEGALTYTNLISGGDPSLPPTVNPVTGDVTDKDAGGQVVFTSNFNPVKLNQDDDRFRLLDQHQVTVKSGAAAEYHVGGEYPLVIANTATAYVEYKKYGAIFSLTPVIDRQDYINATLNMEISSLDFSLVVNGYPALNTVKQSTEVNLKSGETIVIGGYLRDQRTKSEDGIPGLSQVPVLGYVFGSKEFRKTTTEGVVFITPSVGAPTDDPNANPRVRGVVENFESDDFRL